MVKVINVKIEELDFAKEKSAEFTKCLNLVPDLMKYLPKNIKYKVSFELKDTNSDIANGLRRCLLNETPTKCLQYNENSDVETSDPYILSDFLKKQIELIPINQDVEYDDLTITLDIKNNTDEIIDVLTQNFTIKKKDTEIPVDKVMSPLLVISRLRPEEYLKIKNITVKIGIGRDDAAAFCNISNIYYKPIDVVPLNTETKKGESSMTSTPTHFKIGYSTHRNTSKPLMLVKKACTVIIERLELILADIKNISDSADYYYSDLIQMETNGNVKEIQFKNENWTTANLIARFCYILTKGNIKFVTPAIIHPENEIAMVKISHPEFCKLIQDAIKKIIEEFTTIKGSFANL
jgi:DNA-directed RNA polymerase subunit L